jgi:hypothetical protein
VTRATPFMRSIVDASRWDVDIPGATNPHPGQVLNYVLAVPGQRGLKFDPDQAYALSGIKLAGAGIYDALGASITPDADGKLIVWTDTSAAASLPLQTVNSRVMRDFALNRGAVGPSNNLWGLMEGMCGLYNWFTGDGVTTSWTLNPWNGDWTVTTVKEPRFFLAGYGYVSHDDTPSSYNLPGAIVTVGPYTLTFSNLGGNGVTFTTSPALVLGARLVAVPSLYSPLGFYESTHARSRRYNVTAAGLRVGLVDSAVQFVSRDYDAASFAEIGLWIRPGPTYGGGNSNVYRHPQLVRCSIGVLMHNILPIGNYPFGPNRFEKIETLENSCNDFAFIADDQTLGGIATIVDGEPEHGMDNSGPFTNWRQKPITGITATYPVQITVAAHGLAHGDEIVIMYTNNQFEFLCHKPFKVKVIDANTLALYEPSGKWINGSTVGGKVATQLGAIVLSYKLTVPNRNIYVHKASIMVESNYTVELQNIHTMQAGDGYLSAMSSPLGEVRIEDHYGGGSMLQYVFRALHRKAKCSLRGRHYGQGRANNALRTFEDFRLWNVGGGQQTWVDVYLLPKPLATLRNSMKTASNPATPQFVGVGAGVTCSNGAIVDSDLGVVPREITFANYPGWLSVAAADNPNVAQLAAAAQIPSGLQDSPNNAFALQLWVKLPATSRPDEFCVALTGGGWDSIHCFWMEPGDVKCLQCWGGRSAATSILLYPRTNFGQKLQVGPMHLYVGPMNNMSQSAINDLLANGFWNSTGS